jgi:hypothetical protein
VYSFKDIALYKYYALINSGFGRYFLYTQCAIKGWVGMAEFAGRGSSDGCTSRGVADKKCPKKIKIIIHGR